jgi:malate dehydrogenase
MRKKVSIVGAGNVGATAAHWIAAKELADVVLIDVVEGIPQGKALDLLEAMPIEKRDVQRHRRQRLRRHRQLRHRRHHRRHPPQARHEPRRPAAHQLQDHVRRRRQGRRAVARVHPHHRLEPARRHGPGRLPPGRLPRERVIGMAGVLDSARFRTFIAEELNVSVENVTAFVLGGHGDTMVPLPATPPSPASDHRAHRARPPEAIVQRTRDGGAEIVKHLKTGSAYYAPSPPRSRWSKPSSRTRRRSCPAPPILQGEYGISGYYIGVPCKLGAGLEAGLEKIIEIKLTPEEDAALKKSAEAVKELCAVIGVKNWLPFVPGPAFAIASLPGLSNLCGEPLVSS